MPSIYDYRAKFPSLRELPDADLIKRVAEVDGVGERDVMAHMGYEAPPRPSAGVFRTIGDVAIKGAQGVVDVGQSAVGLGSLATGGLLGDAMRGIGYDPKATNDALGEYLSDAQKESDKAVQDASGFVDTLVALARNPRAVAGTIAESLPGVFAMGGVQATVARSIATKAAAEFGGLATEAGAAAAKKAVEDAAGKLMWVGAGTEGAQTAGGQADQAQAIGRTYGEYALPSLAAGAGTALIGRAAGRLMGDAETALFTGSKAAGVTGSFPKRIAKSIFSEGFLEEMPQSALEQVWQNIGQGKPWDEGVANQAATGLVTGGLMGGGMGALQGPGAKSTPPVPAADPVKEILTAPTLDDALKTAMLALPAPAEKANWEVVDGQGLLTGPAGTPIAPPAAPLLSLPPPGETVYIADQQGNVTAQPAAQRAEAITRGTEAELQADAAAKAIQPGDLLTPDGVPYGRQVAANLRAKREGLTTANVVEIPGAGWVIRPKETTNVQVSGQSGFKDGQSGTATDRRSQNANTQTVQNPNVPALVGDEESLQQPQRDELRALRRARDQGVPAVGGELSGLSDRRGGKAEPNALVGQKGQRDGLLPEQRPLGNQEGSSQKYAQESALDAERGDSAAGGVRREIQDRPIGDLQATAARLDDGEGVAAEKQGGGQRGPDVRLQGRAKDAGDVGATPSDRPIISEEQAGGRLVSQGGDRNPTPQKTKADESARLGPAPAPDEKAPPTGRVPVAPAHETSAPASDQQVPAAPEATHKDHGEPAEQATPAVVAESVAKAADKTNRKPSEMKAELLAKVDAAIEGASDETLLPRWADLPRTSRPDQNIHKQRQQEQFDRIGYLTFDIPGDGEFKVLNTKERLADFRKTASRSPGFLNKEPTRQIDDAAIGAQRGSGSRADAFANMIDDGDMQAALDYAKAVGIDPKEAKLTGTLRKRLDKWMADEEMAGKVAAHEAKKAPEKAAPKIDPFADDYAALEGKYVIETHTTDDGKTGKIKLDAAKTLRMFDKREQSLADLKTCLGGH